MREGPIVQAIAIRYFHSISRWLVTSWMGGADSGTHIRTIAIALEWFSQLNIFFGLNFIWELEMLQGA